MKKLFLLLFSVFVYCHVNAQQRQLEAFEKLNAVKFNLLTLATGKFAFEYERFLTPKISAGISLALRPKSSLPFESQITKSFDEEDEILSLISGFKSSTTSFTPEVRFYTSNRGEGRGFYLAPYVKYTKFGFEAPYMFDVEAEVAGETVYDRKEEIPLNGDLKTFTAGLSLGVNFKLSKSVYLDWRFFGPGYGTSKGSVSGKMSLNADEQDGLKEALSELKTDMEDLPVKIKMDYNVTGEGADIKVNNSPWANIRSGLSIGYRF
ncbi:DUF3575 domain-containing protein [Sphingobacterium composti Ten et al. 2007 non Yoo et al. 2007]|uniref:DUF3575 domain-containing protein n=1 Tax=Sphingobacterium composti TaxID=363260 RepID=UPI0013580510|nr:DUF3575 domain-containing protein [Sphingobacterium composti Ten et al. 2007 non Yoo et al. 2007]